MISPLTSSLSSPLSSPLTSPLTSPLSLPTGRPARRPRRRRLAALLLATVATLAPAAAAAPARADGYVPIGGDGSSWSQNAMSQWQADVASSLNMKVNYAGNGSTVGRQAFAAGTVDFAVSEIPYGVVDNGSADVPPTATHPFKYLPIVAGGTAFMYHLDSGGKRITNLRLDDTTVAKIFTGNLSFWDDPEIKRENPGIPLPHRQIVPVVRSDGSGTTAQLTSWLDKQPNLTAMWAAYCSANGRAVTGGHCGTTSFFPASGNFVSLNGSNGVSGYVASDPGEGAITYVEYSYAQNQKYPVAKLLNKSGYYIAPNALNVAVALTNVHIDDQLLQHLEDVYNSSDSRAYPLSSYSYMIVPTSTNSPFSTAKGNTLGAFIQYFLCQGQQHVDLLGYSPLPLNLVQAGLDVARSIPGATVTTTPSSCANPTVSSTGGNRLAEIAPVPAPCDHQGPSQCAADGVTPVPGGGVTGGRTTGGTSGGAAGGTTGGTTGGTSGGGTGTTGGSATGGRTSGGATGGGTGGTSGGSTGGATGGSSGGASGGTTGGATGGGTGGTVGGAAGGTAGGVGGGTTGGTAGGTTGGTAGGAAGGATGGTAIDPDTGLPVAVGEDLGGSAGGTAGGAQPVAQPQVLGAGISGGFQTVLMVVAVVLLILTIAVPPIMARRLARGGDRSGS